MNSKLLGKFAEASSAKIEISRDFGVSHGPVTDPFTAEPAAVVRTDPAAGLPHKTR